LLITEFFTHTPHYEASTGIPNSGESFWVFWGLNWTNWEATGQFAAPGTVNWFIQSNAANFVANSAANWMIQSTLQDSLQTPILMVSRGSMITRWLGEHGTTILRSV
jgi:hypothetical protein